MPRLLALEWNEQEARVVIGSARGKEVGIEQAFSVSMRPSQPGENLPAVDPGQRLAAALAARGVGRLDALVAIGRTNIELRQLSVPPAPDDELPDMVRFQALREFNAMQEDWALDYVPIDEDPGQPRTVLAAAIAPEQIELIRKTCKAAGLKPRRLVLRPCAAASLFCRQQADGRPRARLLVDLIAEEADLTVMIDRKVIFIRTARLPADPLADGEASQALVAELRRTMAAVQNQLGGRRVESIVLCGTGPQHAALAELIDQRLSVPAELFDPFGGLDLVGELARTAPEPTSGLVDVDWGERVALRERRAMPEHPGRFAPLLGMLLDELHGSPPAVDFLHPRRRPAPPSRRPTYALAAAAVVVLVAAVAAYVLVQRSAVSGEIEELQAQVAELDRGITELGKTKKLVDAVDEWRSGDAVWLEELRWLSKNFPPAQEAMVTQLHLLHDPSGARMEVQVLARNSDTIEKVDKALREGDHRIAKEGAQGKPPPKSHSGYELQISRTVSAGQERAPPQGKRR